MPLSGPALVFLLNLLSGFVALLTSYYAYRFNRVVDNTLLKAISLGFMLLGVGLLAEAGVSVVLGRTVVDTIAGRVVTSIDAFAFLSIQVVAYLVIAVGYGLVAYGRGQRAEALAAIALGGVITSGLYRYSLASYFAAFILLGFVVFQGMLIHSRGGGRFSMLVLLAFSLVLVAHLLLFASIILLSGGLFVLGTGVQFLGFLSLLVFILRSGRIGPT